MPNQSVGMLLCKIKTEVDGCDIKSHIFLVTAFKISFNGICTTEVIFSTSNCSDGLITSKVYHFSEKNYFKYSKWKDLSFGIYFK